MSAIPAPARQHLDRPSVVAALADYLRKANDQEGYRPHPDSVLCVRESDRTATLGNAGRPIRGEVYYFIERDLFPDAQATRLGENETPAAAAERLVERIWERLYVWNAYDFALSTSGMYSAPSNL
ncbi:MAG: hypothetical protein LBP86_07615 [Azoarcus sp.]|jgi:hypothetical protein|nr:hypothetical protein [Azoarcus sp.]